MSSPFQVNNDFIVLTSAWLSRVKISSVIIHSYCVVKFILRVIRYRNRVSMVYVFSAILHLSVPYK